MVLRFYTSVSFHDHLLINIFLLNKGIYKTVVQLTVKVMGSIPWSETLWVEFVASTHSPETGTWGKLVL